MKEIKFRAWHKVNKIMHQPCSMFSNWDQKTMSYLAETPLCIFMQFTGLHDKNGKEIYEGDVIEYETPGGDMRGEIRYVSELTAYYIFYRKGQPDQVSAVDDDIVPVLEVIGNIYETPELLDNK